jgi:hypothetical protein
MMTEQEIAKPIVDGLTETGWTVYQEVQCGDSVADIVATQDQPRLIQVLEVKRSIGFAVFEQAVRWIPYANYSFVVTGAKKIRHAAALKIMVNATGIGVLFGDGILHCPARLNRQPKFASRLRDSLCEEQKYWCEAGSANGGHFTTFKQTCARLRSDVERHPGIAFRDLIQKCGNYHYASMASAKSSLLRWIDAGKVPGVIAIRDKRQIRLYPSAEVVVAPNAVTGRTPSSARPLSAATPGRFH